MASNARAEDHAHDSSTDDEGHRSKRRKGPKACDVCRRKKIRCDVDPSGDTNKPCVNCAIFKTECTFTYVAKKRKTQQAVIDSLQNRLTKLERLLLRVAPDIDINKELDETTSTFLSRTRPSSPLKSVVRPPADQNVNAGEIVSAFAEWRDRCAISEDESEDEQSMFVPDVQKGPGDDAILAPHRFHGNSSGISFLKKVIGMRQESTDGEGFSGHHLMTNPDPWERRVSIGPPPGFNFPPPSLMTQLISLFFTCVNPFYPVLHRPSFEEALREGRHDKDPRFGAVTMLMCAAASRWSEDTRVLAKEFAEEGKHGDANHGQSWAMAGWDFYSQVFQRYRKNLLQPTSVYDLQMMALACIYLQGTSNGSAPWQMAGLGVRLALEAGVHRRRRPGSGNVLETELWKRSFWSLVVLDRMGSSGLGMPCAIWEEDIDLDLPLEVDDEYLTPEAGFTQPPNKPSRITYFNYYVKLTQILIGALRTIYSVHENKTTFRLVGPQWEQDMVAALDSSLNSWIDGIPEHLRWDATRSTDDITFHQSALIYCSYHYVQIVVHRPYITPRHSRKSSTSSLDLTFPSLAICTNAARSCSHILEVCMWRKTMFVPRLTFCAFTAAIVLLFNIWGMNKPGMSVRVDWKKQMQDVHICMRFIRRYIGRWKHAEKFWNILRDLVYVGDFPLPGASPPANQKRSRDAEDSPDLGAGGETATNSSSSTIEYSGFQGSRSQSISSTYTPSGTHDSEFRNSGLPPQGRNSELSGAVYSGIKSEPLMFDQLQLQSNPYQIDGGGSPYKIPDQQGQQQQQQQRPQQPQSQLSSPAGAFQYDAEALLRSFSFDQRGNLNNGPQGSPQGHQEQVPRADDVLTALDAVYLGSSSSTLADTEAVHDATYDVWGGSAQGGFQWNEWQQFTNVVQSAPVQMAPGTTGHGEQPLMWTQY